MKFWDIIAFLSVLVLEGVFLFYRFRKKIANANREIADQKKIIAEKDKIIEETKILKIDQVKARLELQTVQFTVQDKLDSENKKYKDAQQHFADNIEQMGSCIKSGEDGSEHRNLAVKLLTGDVLDSFHGYIDRARIHYADHKPLIIKEFLTSEVIPFLSLLQNVLQALNSEGVLEKCKLSQNPFEISAASLGPIRICLLELLPYLDQQNRVSIIEMLKEANQPVSLIDIEQLEAL